MDCRAVYGRGVFGTVKVCKAMFGTGGTVGGRESVQDLQLYDYFGNGCRRQGLLWTGVAVCALAIVCCIFSTDATPAWTAHVVSTLVRV